MEVRVAGTVLFLKKYTILYNHDTVATVYNINNKEKSLVFILSILLY